MSTHPGNVLVREYLSPMGLTPEALAIRTGRPEMNGLALEIVDVTPDLAQALAEALETSPDFWLSLQAAHDNRGPRRRQALRAARRPRTDGP